MKWTDIMCEELGVETATAIEREMFDDVLKKAAAEFKMIYTAALWDEYFTTHSTKWVKYYNLLWALEITQVVTMREMEERKAKIMRIWCDIGRVRIERKFEMLDITANFLLQKKAHKLYKQVYRKKDLL